MNYRSVRDTVKGNFEFLPIYLLGKFLKNTFAFQSPQRLLSIILPTPKYCRSASKTKTKKDGILNSISLLAGLNFERN